MKTFLECYNKWIEKGSLPHGGLCFSLPEKLLKTKAWKMVKPTADELGYLFHQDKPSVFWGKDDFRDNFFKLTQTRLNILLIAACLNNEKL